MNTVIRAFARALQGVMLFLRDHVVTGIHARAEMAWENFDNWLINHGYTLPQLIGYFFTTIGGLLAAGLAFDVIGLCFGTVDHEMVARGFITVGTLIGLLGLLPLFLLANAVKGFFNLIVRGGEAACDILEADRDNHLPARIRQQLQHLRNRPDHSNTLRAIYAAFAALNVAFLCWPNFYGLFGVIAAGLAVSGIIALRQIIGVKGHGIARLTMAGAYGFAGVAIVYVILKFIAQPFFTPSIPQIVTGATAEILIVLSAALAGAITFLVQAFTMRLTDEEEDLRRGDVTIRDFHLEATAVDPATGRPTAYRAHSKEPYSWKWLKSRSLWLGVTAVVLVVGLFVWTQVLGHPLPRVNMSYKTIALIGVGLLAYGIFSTDEKKA
jgi:hypothetical protein